MNNKEIKEIKEIKNFYNIDYNKEMDNKEMDNNETVINLSNEEILKLKEMITSFKPKAKREVKYIIVEPKESKPKKEKKEKPEKPKKEPKPNRDENNKPLKFTCECGGVYTHLSKWCHNQSQKHKHYEEKGEILKKTCFNFTKKDLTPEELEKRKAWYREYTKTHKFPKKLNVCKDLIKNLDVNIHKEEDEILKNIINLISEDKPSHSVN